MHFCRSWRPRWSSTSRRRQGSWLQRWEKNMMLRIQFSTTQGQMLYFLEVLSSNSESENHWTFVDCAGENRAEQVGATCMCEGGLRRRNLPTTSWYLLKIWQASKLLKLLLLIVNAIVELQTGWTTLIVQDCHSHWCVYNFFSSYWVSNNWGITFWPAFTLQSLQSCILWFSCCLRMSLSYLSELLYASICSEVPRYVLLVSWSIWICSLVCPMGADQDVSWYVQLSCARVNIFATEFY